MGIANRHRGCGTVGLVSIPLVSTDLIGATVPKNSKVGRCYDSMVRKGASKGKAARICQSSTGQSLRTGKKPKGKK